MTGTRTGGIRLWRWRHNPLRRRSDVIDAWMVLVAWLLALAGGLLAGLTTASAVDHGLDRQRTERHAVSAVLRERAPGRTSASAVDDSHVWATVRWTAPDGSSHTGQARVHPGTRTGARVAVWIDGQGRLTSKPLAPGEASLQATWSGALVAVGTAGAVLGGAQIPRVFLERRQLGRWDEEWARIDNPRGWKTG
ncbi:hypothetical protein ABZT04_42260 [Streptomyces sp. NPDC005492]|uniref:Rv1733c family protein n=1 Tax=Streptomyces sp. NPDC005492 TaxID=3156883 RepID=UPI0033A1F7DE